MLRKQARTARMFAARSRRHEDNQLPPKPWDFSAVRDEDDTPAVDFNAYRLMQPCKH
jgi:hypothetical protein